MCVKTRLKHHEKFTQYVRRDLHEKRKYTVDTYRVSKNILKVKKKKQLNDWIKRRLNTDAGRISELHHRSEVLVR